MDLRLIATQPGFCREKGQRREGRGQADFFFIQPAGGYV